MSKRSRRKQAWQKAHCPLGGANPCGYCKKHHVSVTVKQMKNRQCLQKGCWYFRKYEQHGYWKMLEQLNSKKDNGSSD